MSEHHVTSMMKHTRQKVYWGCACGVIIIGTPQEVYDAWLTHQGGAATSPAGAFSPDFDTTFTPDGEAT